MSDTPRMDSALRRSQEDYTESYLLTEGLKLERELNAANAIIRQQQLLNEENLRLQERIQRLEETGNELYDGWRGERNTKDKHLAAWLKAKEDKP